MTRRARRFWLSACLFAGAAGLAAAKAPVAWEDLTEADWLYSLATRFAEVDGHRVHYPTPTAELVPLLEQRAEAEAKRHLADARLALGDRAGALAALEAWATAEGAAAWAEAARWAAAQGETAFAFRAAAKGLPGLPADEKAKLATERVEWADAHPEAADPLSLRAERAALLPDDADAAEDWIRALEKAGKLDEALAAVEKSAALPPARRLLLRSDLAADHGDDARAFSLLDAAVEASESWPPEARKAFADRADKARPGAPEAWRAALERAFDAPALLRLATYFQGKERGDRAADLLRQVERRYDETLDRRGFLLVSRLHAQIDSVPEAFRARLAAAAKASPAEQADDLAALGRLALRAGSRPLGWGRYGEEPYRWAARVDRTAGFWTGGVAFLLTGTDWKASLESLEQDALPERTFQTARALVAELEKRQPAHAELASLRAGLMSRFVERGEGREALALLPLVEKGDAKAAAEGRKAALLAMRQVEVPVAEESRVFRARLAALAPDGSRPEMTRRWGSKYGDSGGASGVAWSRSVTEEPAERYRDVLDEAVSRLDQRDETHAAAASLLLAEMDRLPQAEELWSELADRLEGWNLDDELGPRYERAVERFSQPGWWARAARFYARRSRHRELDRLATDLAARFRASDAFARAPQDDRVRLEVPDQPRVGTRVRLVAWADWVRLKALERFPHSPQVFREAQARLVRRSAAAQAAAAKGRPDRVVVDDALLDERGWAVLFADDARREQYLAEGMKTGALAAKVAAWETSPARTPVEERLLFEGRARLSQFEAASAPADRLAALYPGDGALAAQVLSLHRSLAGLDVAHAAPAEALVARTAPALVDPAPLWSELGELQYERGRPDRAKDAWRHVLDQKPRDARKIEDLATLLWDYGETDDALAVLEDGRKRTGRPSLLAFEAGVLREEKKDLEGAVREYLAAGLPDEGECFCSAFERDQRSLRRLAQLAGRARARQVVEARLAALRPGVAADEETLVAFYPLATIRMPDADLDWTADDWIDALDHPVDPLARDAARESRERWRAATREGQARLSALLLERTRAMVAQGTKPAFLDAVERWAKPLVEAQPSRGDDVALTSAVMARRAALATTAEDRVTREIARARYLYENGRTAEADEAWKGVASRVATLPEGAPRMRAEAERAAYLERAQGVAAAAAEWERLASRYPWSLGVLEDRLAFLNRNGRGAEARTLVEAAAPKAAAGHREDLLARLATEAIEAKDLAQTQRAAEAMLALPGVDDGRRLAAIHLLARLELRRDPATDLLGLVKRESPRLQPDSQAELHAQVARAAALESAWKPSLTLWIEALNRRLDRGFLREACDAAEHAGETASLVSFFEKQRERSPRDVRWAVALREMKLWTGDVDGAVAAARAAITVRPERGTLWTEAADLLGRAGRPKDAADLLADWAKTHPGDEDTASRRAAFLAAAGDASGALAIEREALAAYAAAGPKDDERTEELAIRRGRAAVRLLNLGLPQKAWALLAATPGSAKLAPNGLGEWREAEIALGAGRFPALLKQRIGDESFVSTAGGALASMGRPEQREEVLRYMTDVALPEGPAKAGNLDRVWNLAQQANLEAPLRTALARRLVGRTPGPWATATPEAFVDAVAESVVGEDPVRVVTPSFDRLWARHLAAQGRGDDLAAFLAPRFDALAAQVQAGTPLGPKPERREWAAWLDDEAALGLWTAAVARDPQRGPALASMVAERRTWDRLWALAARGWDATALVAALPDDARAKWLRLWLQPSPADADPAVRSRGEAVAKAVDATTRLVARRDGAPADPDLAALRGGRTVGAVLDAGQGWNADVWGERPGPSWLVLEALVRHREKDPDAALVPLEAMDRGGEARRARIAARLAEAQGDAALALTLAGSVPQPTAADLERRLRLLKAAGRADDAAALFRDEVRRQQPRLNDGSLRALARLATDLGLADPVSLLDPAVPMPGPAVAAVCDARGLAACRPLKAVDPADFRTALAARWSQRARPLSGEETRFGLAELWANDTGSLPDVRRLPGLWPKAGAWLATVRTGERRAAIAAIDALPDDAPLRAIVARDAGASSEAARLLLVRAALARGDDAKAVALFQERLAELRGGSGLSFAPVQVSAPEAEGEDGEFEAGSEDGDAESGSPAADPLVTGLRAWLEPFRESKKIALVATAASEALPVTGGAARPSPAAWALAVDLAPSAEARAAALARVERAWRLGDLWPASLAPVAESAAAATPADADRWLARLDTGVDFDGALSRARLLSRIGRKAEGAAFLARLQPRVTWTAFREVKAFDRWRTLAPTAAAKPATPAAAADPVPAAWTAARAFWTRAAADPGEDLARHLRAHPLDLRAARAALRTAAPGDPAAMALAARALKEPAMSELGDSFGDEQLLGLRAARALRASSVLAAREAQGNADASFVAALERRRLRAAEVVAAARDMALVFAASGEAAPAAAVLAAVEDRAPAQAAELRAEMAKRAAPPGPPRSYRLVDGKPAPWRPRDLDWSAVEAVLEAEGVR